MSKMYMTIKRRKSELIDTPIIKDYFSSNRDVNYMVLYPIMFNGVVVPCYILRADFRQNMTDLKIYTTSNNERIPDDSFTHFTLGIKSTKIVNIQHIETPKTYKSSNRNFYVISEFISFIELFGKESYEHHFIDGYECKLIDVRFNNKLEFIYFDLIRGKVLKVNSNQLNQQYIVKLLNKKHYHNVQQYVMVLCNIMMEQIRIGNEHGWGICEKFTSILYHNNIKDYDKYSHYMDKLLYAK